MVVIGGVPFIMNFIDLHLFLFFFFNLSTLEIQLRKLVYDVDI